jgi:hypothetical protein
MRCNILPITLLHCNALQHITQRHFLKKEAANPSDLKYHQERTDSHLQHVGQILIISNK